MANLPTLAGMYLIQQQAVLTAGFQSTVAGANAGMPVMPSQHVVIRKSEIKANFIRLSEMDFYKQLGKKLTQWNHTSAMEEPQ